MAKAVAFSFDKLSPSKQDDLLGRKTKDGKSYETVDQLEEAFTTVELVKEKSALKLQRKSGTIADPSAVKEDIASTQRVLRLLSQKLQRNKKVDKDVVAETIKVVKFGNDAAEMGLKTPANNNAAEMKRRLGIKPSVERLTLDNDTQLLHTFLGRKHKHLDMYQKYLKVEIEKVQDRNDILDISSDVPGEAKFAKGVMLDIWNQAKTASGNMESFEVDEIVLTATIQKRKESQVDQILSGNDQILVNGPNGKVVKARSSGQKQLVANVAKNDINFAIGAAGSGKTYTAVALAVKALKEKQVKKIVLTRPAVEAGENLGFLPGDLKNKVDPYLRPLYDALDDMIPADKLSFYMTNRTIEVAPLAYMRGRTLDNAFIILDEAQNATDLQMKMFLTRIGPNSKAVITGDETQCDLPKGQRSGLQKALRILKKVDGIGQTRLTVEDNMRHRLVKDIISAYDTEDAAENRDEMTQDRRQPPVLHKKASLQDNLASNDTLANKTGGAPSVQ